ncbi:probable palmitoyltransferase ZDHHC24 [Ornithodoros turicata]|uniref:probable palmitoyltransferase ZDHHC24 n=1 Tax=Ornithodoros turicata TaxID=34597 RepID=UPI003138D1BE
MNPILPVTRRLPNSIRDRVLCMFLFVMTPVITFFEFAVVVPRYHDTVSPVVCVHVVLGMFIVMNIMGNMFKLTTVNTSLRRARLPAVLLPGWRYCHVCQENAPPRSHHCSLCNECILKHDHHCMFVGRCVGYFNHRYFLMGLIYLWIGTMYSLIYQFEYCIDVMGGLRPLSLVMQLMPHFGFFLGFLNPLAFACAMVNLFLVLVVILCSYLLVTQIIGICRNQSAYEQRHSVGRYNVGLRRNLQEAMGSAWFLTWISPWIKSPPTGDGVHFAESIECLYRLDATKHL